MRVGTKALKNRLSYYLRRVRKGDALYVTDRGTIVAELRRAPAAGEGEPNVLREMEADGLLTQGGGRLDDFEPIRPRGRTRLSRLVLDGRD